ncbi:MAG TPA: hypothetical protein VH639_18065 [Bryobacteraceae bacterium]|jgi:hypothetical protein
MKRKSVPAQKSGKNQGTDGYLARASGPVATARIENEGAMKFTAREISGATAKSQFSGMVKEENDSAIKTSNRFAKGRAGAHIDDGSRNK